MTGFELQTSGIGSDHSTNSDLWFNSLFNFLNNFNCKCENNEKEDLYLPK